MSGTFLRISARDLPCTCSAYATFWYTLRLGSSLKSWNTQPMLRRRIGTFDRFSLGSERPPTIRLPDDTSSSFSSSLMNVDLPEPDAPTRNTNSPLSICRVTSSRPTMFGS